MKAMLITILFVTSFIFTFGHAQAGSPKFSHYPVSNIYVGQSAPVDFSNREAYEFKTRLRQAAKGSANFAGKYVLTTWGCGSSCVMGAVINRKTGNISFLPGSICCWEGEDSMVQFRLNSRLLVTAGLTNEGGEYGAHFYEFTGRKFRHIKTIPVAKPEPDYYD